MSLESLAYEKHKNLKLAAEEIGIDWQVLYSRLKDQGVAVTGDKARYGSERDKLAARAEALFIKLVPKAVDQNKAQWQSKFDFLIDGYKVDVKVSSQNIANARKPDALRWSFLFVKQRYECDFMCCFCLSKDGETVEKLLVVPREFFADIQTMSVACSGRSKWNEFEVDPSGLAQFFSLMPKREAPIDTAPKNPALKI